MNKVIELTNRLKELGVEFRITQGAKLDIIILWTIESCIKWIREKGYSGYVTWGTEFSRVKISEHDDIAVSPGSELQGLLECMVKIMEGESGKS